MFQFDKAGIVEMSIQKNREPSGALATVSLALAGSHWGTGFLFGKIAFSEMTVSENVTLRFAFASVALIPVLLRHKCGFRRRDFGLLLLGSIVGFPVQFLVQFKGLQLTTVSHASLMVGTLPIMVALASAFYLKEHLTKLEWAALTASAIGAALISLSNRPGTGPRASAKGDLLVLASMVAAVAMILITKQLMVEYDALFVTASMIVIGTVLLITGVIPLQPLHIHFSARAWMAVAAQGFLATAMAYALWNWGLARVPASRASVFLNMEPIVGTVLGVLVLNEKLGSLAGIGGAIILAAAIYFSGGRLR
jgi:drug/metabolite transporter (DMT)-like permease